ncbi:hypothetical protein KSP40_PGU011796 [Platanthera guangdongensis]|uniref:Uncharacterized protein n=1 Tax=Platanthera guangdongensis TaxID=2320717 RepID=A0ABR2MZ24_9ASPA
MTLLKKEKIEATDQSKALHATSSLRRSSLGNPANPQSALVDYSWRQIWRLGSFNATYRFIHVSSAGVGPPECPDLDLSKQPPAVSLSQELDFSLTYKLKNRELGGPESSEGKAPKLRLANPCKPSPQIIQGPIFPSQNLTWWTLIAESSPLLASTPRLACEIPFKGANELSPAQQEALPPEVAHEKEQAALESETATQAILESYGSGCMCVASVVVVVGFGNGYPIYCGVPTTATISTSIIAVMVFNGSDYSILQLRLRYSMVAFMLVFDNIYDFLW